MTEYRNGNLNATILATIHDAIFFQVNEGDYDTINHIAEVMRTSANRILNAPEGWTIKVGEPDIIKNGDIWCAGNEQFVEQFKELLNFKS